MSRRTKVLLGVGGGVIVAAIVIMNLRARAGHAVTVEMAPAARGEVLEKVTASGKVQPEVSVKITSNVSGPIEAIGVKEGDSVKKGDFLVRLDPTRYQAFVDQARAGVSSAEAEARLAEAQCEQAERSLARLDGLDGKGLSSEQEMEAARTQVKVSRATFEAARQRVAQANATLEEAEDQLRKTTVISPMDGVITQLNSEVGEVVLGTSQFEGTNIMTVADLSRMEVEVEVDENDIVQVSLGDTATIEVDALPDTTFKGIVTEIANTAVTRGRGTQEEITNFPLKVAFMDCLSALRPGMSASVDILTDRRGDVIQVPTQAVTMREPKSAAGKGEGKAGGEEKGGKEETGGGKTEGSVAEAAVESTGTKGPGVPEKKLVDVVFVVKDGKAELREVKTGLMGETNVEIVSGIDEGEKIVVGSYRVVSRDLQDGNAVKEAKPGEAMAGRKGTTENPPEG